jgi:hypothetical protein
VTDGAALPLLSTPIELRAVRAANRIVISRRARSSELYRDEAGGDRA